MPVLRLQIAPLNDNIPTLAQLRCQECPALLGLKLINIIDAEIPGLVLIMETG
jgi:hypothetical protein